MHLNNRTNCSSNFHHSFKPTAGSATINNPLTNCVGGQQQLLFDNRQAHLKPPPLTQTGQPNFGALLSLSRNGSSLCDNLHRLCSAGAMFPNGHSSTGHLGMTSASAYDLSKVYFHNESNDPKFHLSDSIARPPFSIPHSNSLGSSHNSQNSFPTNSSLLESSQSHDLAGQNRLAALLNVDAPSEPLLDRTSEALDPNNRFCYGRTSTGSSGGHSEEFCHDLAEDSGHSLNSSSDGDSATFGRGVAGASSPLNARHSHPYRHFEFLNQPEDDEEGGKEEKEIENFEECPLSGHVDCLPLPPAPPPPPVPTDSDNVQSSSLKALLSGRSSINYLEPAGKEAFDPFASKRRVSPGNEQFSYCPFRLTANAKCASNLTHLQRPPPRSKQNFFPKTSNLKNIDEENSFNHDPTTSPPAYPKPTNELLLSFLLPSRAQLQPITFNMDNVFYVTSEIRAQQIVERVLRHQQFVSISCESDCDLRQRIDLLSLAVAPQKAPGSVVDAHPQVFVFDVRLQPLLIQRLRPLFAASHVLKVLFDSRLTLRLLRRVYGICTFVGLFDVQLAYRVLMTKLTNRPFNQVQREQLIQVAWQCNGPPINFQRPVPRPGQPTSHFQNCRSSTNPSSTTHKLPYWSVRPITTPILYNAACDAFMLVPQLAFNLMSMMELVLSDRNKQFFKQLGDELIARHLMQRHFFSFQHRQEYLAELQRQVSLLTASASVDRLGFTSAQSFSGECLLHASQSEHLMTNFANLPTPRICGHLDQVGCKPNCVRPEEFWLQSTKHEKSVWEFESDCSTGAAESNQSKRTPSCDQDDWTFKSQLIKCKCDQKDIKQLRSEAKCMNLLVDQIIDLIEMKDDF